MHTVFSQNIQAAGTGAKGQLFVQGWMDLKPSIPELSEEAVSDGTMPAAIIKEPPFVPAFTQCPPTRREAGPGEPGTGYNGHFCQDRVGNE